MKSRLILLALILLTSCEKNDTEVTISGTVRDAVTGTPVSGASVMLCVHYSCEGRTYTNSIGLSCITDQEGKYTFNYKYNNDNPPVFKDNCSSAGQSRPYPFPAQYAVFASKSGYITTDYHSLSDNYLDNADIKLYHRAQLNIHAKNEGINKAEAVRVCIDRGLGYTIFGTPEFVFTCSGKDFDSEIVVNNLWGGFQYTCKVLTLSGSYSNPMPLVNKSILLTPDTVNYLSVTY